MTHKLEHFLQEQGDRHGRRAVERGRQPATVGLGNMRVLFRNIADTVKAPLPKRHTYVGLGLALRHMAEGSMFPIAI